MRRALILDRDGVINHDDGYVHQIEHCRFVEGIFDLAADFAAHGYLLIVATNQSGIGRGLYSEADFASLMGWMKEEFAAHGASIAAVYHCPYHPTEGTGRYRAEHPWRKPSPGMLLQAIADFDLDPAGSWLVGDQMRDIEAGRGAQIGTLVLLDPAAPLSARREDYFVAPRLADIRALLAQRSIT